jgi:hypothetical protein
VDFQASLLLAIQAGNWQRSGGKGDKPKRINRPKEVKQNMTAADVEQRKKRLKAARYGN